MLTKGLTHRINRKVNLAQLATTVGSGTLPVLATPALIAALEEAASLAVAPHLPEGSTTVGGHIEVSHLKPTGMETSFYAEAELIEIDRSKLTFTLTAYDETGQIGKGSHIRFIVDGEKFMENIK